MSVTASNPPLPSVVDDTATASGPQTLPRPAWINIDLEALRGNFRAIRSALPARVRLLYVLKDNAYGIGAVRAARLGLAEGVSALAAYTLDEAVELRRAGIEAPILLLGERSPEEWPWCIDHRLTPCLGSLASARDANAAARRHCRRLEVHLKINTGMNRYGFPWRETMDWAPALASLESLSYQGALSHFAQSDEADKTFARLQLDRFLQCIGGLRSAGIAPATLHLCNSGGFLDLPDAHLDMVRIGILATGVYPSAVCRRIGGLRSVLSVRARINAVQLLQPGDTVGYGMRYCAGRPSRIAVLPLGYGDGFPRVRNEGFVLIRGRRAPLVGGVAMDAITVDITDIPEAELHDEAVILGRQGAEEITAHDLAALKRSVSYDILANWRSRLPRREIGHPREPAP